MESGYAGCTLRTALCLIPYHTFTMSVLRPCRYYLNGVDAYRLKLMVPHEVVQLHAEAREGGEGFVDVTDMGPAVQSLHV